MSNAKKPTHKGAFDLPVFLAKIARVREPSSYTKDQIVFHQGDPADSVFYLQTGKVKISVVSEQGKEAVAAILALGEFFGEGCLAGQNQRLATATALTPSGIFEITKANMLRAIHDEPSFADRFMAHLLARTSRAEADLVDQLFNSSEKRLARTLLLLANFGKESEPEPILTKISQATLAEMIGTTRSRVNHFMNKFRKLGFIDYNGHIEVRPSLLNAVLHEKPQSEA